MNFSATLPSFWRSYGKPAMLKAFGEKGRVTLPPMQRLTLLALLAVSLFVSEGLCPHLLSAAPLTSTHAEQTQVSLTIYNSNLGLVKDVREIELAEGVTRLHFMDVAARIMPTTVLIRSQTNSETFQVLEQNYEYDLLSPETLLEKYVGKEVRLLDKNYFYRQRRTRDRHPARHERLPDLSSRRRNLDWFAGQGDSASTAGQPDRPADARVAAPGAGRQHPHH